MCAQWKSLAGRVDEQRYGEVLAQLEYQAGQAQVWRDAVTNWFFRESGIADAKGRVGHYPGRIEAESMRLEGYTVVSRHPLGSPLPAARPSRAVARRHALRASTSTAPRAGTRYAFNISTKTTASRIFACASPTNLWTNGPPPTTCPPTKIDGSSSTRRTVAGIALRSGR